MSKEKPPSLVEKIGQEMAKDIIGVEPLKPPESLEKLLAERYAKEIVDVQPMSGDAIKMMYEQSLSTEELKEQGYKPVSNLGLLWVKENE
jgi:hypothetical protein